MILPLFLCVILIWWWSCQLYWWVFHCDD